MFTGRAAVDVSPDALGREERRLHRLDPPAQFQQRGRAVVQALVQPEAHQGQQLVHLRARAPSLSHLHLP